MNEVAMRLARASTRRPGVVCFRGSFHGRTPGRARRDDSKAAFRLGLGTTAVHVAPFPRPEELAMPLDDAAAHAPAELDQLHRHQLAPRRPRAT